MRVRILYTQHTGPLQVAVAEFRFEHGALTSHPLVHPAGTLCIERTLMQRMMTESGELVTAQDHPEAWLAALPLNLSGTYERAMLVDEAEKLADGREEKDTEDHPRNVRMRKGRTKQAAKNSKKRVPKK